MQFTSIALFFASALLVAASPAPNNAGEFAPTPVLKKRFATNTLPASSGHSVLSTPKVIAAGASFDGGMVRFDRGGKSTQSHFSLLSLTFIF